MACAAAHYLHASQAVQYASARALACALAGRAGFCTEARGGGAAPAAEARPVSAEAAHVVASRHVGVFDVPSYMRDAAEDLVSELDMTPRQLRTIAVPLEHRVRRPAVSASRGGAALPLPLPPTAPALPDAADALAATATPPPAPAQQRLPPVAMVPQPPARRLGPKGAAALAATQLPARYAALRRIFDELRFRAPDWTPTTALDVRSGAGAGLWAARKTWSTALLAITAVEPSAALVATSVRIQQALLAEDATAPMPSIRWVSTLPKLPKAAPAARPAPPPPRRHDLVIAAHTLTDDSDAEARRRAVRDAWRRCAGVLVIMEPGTPTGSALVREARAQLLREEAKRETQLSAARVHLRRLEAHAALLELQGGAAYSHTDSAPSVDALGADAAPPAPAATEPGSLEAAQARVRALEGTVTGVHVLAPCAHDGACPMDAAPASAGWCHFRQRFERTYLHRMCKARKGADRPPKNWQFENFSFVALRRGPRPPPPADVFIEPNFIEFEEDALQYASVPPQILDAARALGDGAAAELRPEEVFPFLADGAAAGAAAAAEAAADGAAELRGTAGSGGKEEWPEAARFLDEYLASVSELGGHADGVKSLRLHLQRGGVLPADRGGDAAAPNAALGVTDSDAVQQHEDVGGGTAAADGVVAEVVSSNGAQTGEHQSLVPNAGTTRFVAAAAAPPGEARGGATPTDGAEAEELPRIRFGGPSDGAAATMLERPVRAAEPEAELWLRGRDWSRLDARGVSRARAAAAAWSRVLRRPHKRGRHVVLDLCVAAPDQRSGVLERHIIARSDRHRPWLGRAAYRLARRTQWGDLWPTVYHKNFRVRRWQ